jgi:hypothetical protein
MSRTGGRTNDDAAEQTHTQRAGEWFAESTLRIALAVFGFVLLLFALGQAVGIDLLGMVVGALTTQMGRWLLVAFFALAIILIAVRGFDWGTSGASERESDRGGSADRDRNR